VERRETLGVANTRDVLARHVETLARRLASLAIGTPASRRSTTAFLDAPSALPVFQGGDKGSTPTGLVMSQGRREPLPAPPNGTISGRRPSTSRDAGMIIILGINVKAFFNAGEIFFGCRRARRRRGTAVERESRLVPGTLP
jgi:hypothetical protein